MPNPMSDIYKRLSEIGFDRKFVKEHVLPDWWDDELGGDPPSRFMAEFDIARHLGLDFSKLADPASPLSLQPVKEFRLKHSRGAAPADMLPAVVVAQRAAKLVLDQRKLLHPFRGMPTAHDARETILRSAERIDLKSIVDFAWDHGIAVIHLDPRNMPRKGRKFHAMAFFPGSHPVVVLAFGSDSPPRLGYHLAHELGHLFCKHVEPGGDCLVDSEIDEIDDDRQEQEAGEFAMELLTGERHFALPPCGPRLDSVVETARRLGETLRADAGSVALFIGRSTGNWMLAQLALDRLEQNAGAQAIIADALRAHLDLEDLPESTERFLSCLSAQLV